MKILIIYDSLFGNTKVIAQAIAEASTAANNQVIITGLNEASLVDLKAVSLLIVGSPTQGGRPTPALQKFLEQIPAKALNQVNVAALDTRFLEEDQGFGLRILMKVIRYATPRIADSLKSKGGTLIAPPEGFIVKAKEGPLADGEVERAKTWAQLILKNLGKN